MPDLLAQSGELGGLVLATSNWYVENGYRMVPEYIEKDFWVTEALRSLVTPHQLDVTSGQKGVAYARVVFKGGTSLSKAHRLIDRYSEDIDLYVVTRFVEEDNDKPPSLVQPDTFKEDRVGDSRADTLMKGLAARLAEDTGQRVDPAGGKPARTGTRRAFELHYPAQQGVSSALKRNVLVELTRMGAAEPVTRYPVRSMLAEYAIQTGQATPSDFAEFAEVEVDVLMPHRTLVEKLCAMQACGQAVTDGRGFNQMARHFYDVYQLLGNDGVVDSLRADTHGTAGIADDVAETSKRDRRTPGFRPNDGFASSTWVVDDDVRQAAAAAYDVEVPPLVYGAVPGFDAVVERVKESADLL